MSAPRRLYQQIMSQITRSAGPTLRRASIRRLALLVTGVVSSQHCTLRRVARELHALGLSGGHLESTVRRMRRTVADARLDAGAGYGAAVQALVVWPTQEPVLLVLDESTTATKMHVLRLSLAYRGSCLPLAWSVWSQQTRLPPGAYGQHLDRVITAAAAIIPPGIPVIVLADRAYDVPSVVDRLTAQGWDWIIRLKARGTVRWQASDGTEQPVCEVVAQTLTQPGTVLTDQGAVFKAAGWRQVRLVGSWQDGYDEPLVVLTSLEAKESVLARYAKRFWIEAAFRQDKSAGWDWEHSQLRDPARQERLLLALAWATLLTLSLGAQQAAVAMAQFQTRRHHARPRHPRQSLFSLGLDHLRARLFGTVRGPLTWALPHLTAPSWCAQWLALQMAPPSPLPVPP